MKHRWIKQTRLHIEGVQKGNCTEAAVASILGLSLDDVPDFHVTVDSNLKDSSFENLYEDAYNFWTKFEDFLNSCGFYVLMQSGNYVPDCLYLASGKSPRELDHTVVMRKGELIHDPHPDNTGLMSINCIYILVPEDPGKIIFCEDPDMVLIVKENPDAN